MSVDGEAARQKTNDLVVVGSSAGGIGALSVLVSTLRTDFPAPIVLAQHLDPQRPSNLAAILERRSTLPVVVVGDVDPTHLENGKIYVVPANRHVRINDGHVQLEADHDNRPRPSVDLLLSTAAESYGEHLIAVILTGSGSDGAAGAVDVKNAGGVVIIQNPETAPYPSMPLSLPPTAVDHISEVEQIGPLLYDLIQGVRIVEEEVKIDDPLNQLLAHVSRQTNIDFRNYKPATILRRIARRLAVTGNATIRDYMQYLEIKPDETGELVKSFLIGVTGFFRDAEAFLYLKREILPQLIERGREQGRVLRFWSAGCATGEEPYSLATLLADLLGAELPEWNIRIFATDLHEAAISFARRGLFPTAVLKDLPDEYLRLYFEPVNQGFRIIKLLRQMVIFGSQDLSRAAPFPRIDLLLCRNLLIYLKPELQQSMLNLFAYSLQTTQGYLFLGKAETVRPTTADFEQVSKRWRIYRCVSGPLIIARDGRTLRSGGGQTDAQSLATTTPAHLYASAPAQQASRPPEADIGMLRRFNELMLRYLPIGAVIINRSYRIMTINGTARRLLGMRELSHEQDFLHAVRGLPYTQVRDAIDTAFREQNTVTLPEVELEAVVGGSGRYVNLTIMLMQMETGVSDLAVISATDATETVQTRRRLDAVQAEQVQLVGDLTAANKRLSEMNKELQDANEELQATNEELMLTQEELQATNEEFEATNEELQATNEELETNNEELQATNEELQTTNDELTARTNELQETTSQLASERIRFSEMVEMAPFYIMLLKGPGLIVESFNPNYTRIIKAREVIGYPFEEVFSGAEMSHFIEMVREAYRNDRTIVTPKMRTHVPDERGETVEHHFIHHLVPLHNGDGKVDGLIIYTENVTEREGRQAKGSEVGTE